MSILGMSLNFINRLIDILIYPLHAAELFQPKLTRAHDDVRLAVTMWRAWP